MHEYITDAFVITEDAQTSNLELWIDWVPAVDSNPSSDVIAHLDGHDLLIVPHGMDVDKRTRRVVGIAPDLFTKLHTGFVFKLCGPSGVLAEHALKPTTNT